MSEDSSESPGGPSEPSGRPGPRSTRGPRRATFFALLALVPVAVLTVLRSFDLAGGVPDTLVAFTPYAIPCALIAVGLALWGRSVLMGVVAAALLCAHVALLAPMYVPDGPTVRGYPTTAMSINLQYGQGDPAQVVDLIRDHDVELLSVQELTPRAMAELGRAGLDELLPHRHVRPETGSPAGTGIWSASSLTPTSFGNERPTAFENLRATVSTRGGVRVDVLAVHPFPPLPSTSRSWRRDIAELVRIGVPADRPMIMLGDFNATRDHGPMRRLAEQGLVDAADQAAAGYGPTWGPGGPLPPMFEIDHILVSQADIRATEVTRHVVDHTDHKAVIAQLTISEATSDDPG